MFAFVISVGLVVARWRNSGAAGGENYYDDIPELPYAIPGRALETSRVSSSEPSSDYEVVQIDFGLKRNSP